MRHTLIAAILLLVTQSPAHGQAVGTRLRQIWGDSATDVFGAVSRDGKLLLYTDWSSSDIGLRDLTSGHNRRITDSRARDGFDPASMVFSRDQLTVAYTVAQAGDSQPSIRLLSLEGGPPRVIYRGPGTWTTVSAWTPDGTGLITTRSVDARKAELGVVSVADGSFHLLATGRGIMHADISPDGRFVAFEEWSLDNPALRHIRIVSTSSGTARALVAGADDWSPAWTPDGRGVVFISDRGGGRGLWHIPVRQGRSAGPPVRLFSLGADMTILGVSDSGTVFLGEEGYGLTTYTAHVRWPEGGVDDARALQTPVFRDARRAVFSPDSRQVAFMLKPRSYGVRPGWLTPAVRSMSGGGERHYPTRLTLRDEPAWYPDGKSMLFVIDEAGSGEGGGPPWTFWRLDLASGQYRQVGSSTLAGLVRVVGLRQREFVYRRNDYSTRPIVSSIASLDLDNGATRERYRLTGSDIIANASLSHAGDQIALAITDSLRRTTIAVLASGAAQPRPIATLRAMNARAQLMWFADDRAVLVSGQIGSEQGLWRVLVDGGPPQRILLDASKMTEARLSPDGQHLAWTVRGSEPSRIWALDGVVARDR